MPVDPKLMPGAKKEARYDIYDYDCWSIEGDAEPLFSDVPAGDIVIEDGAACITRDETVYILPDSKLVYEKRFVEVDPE